MGAAFKAIGPDLSRAPGSMSQQRRSVKGLSSDLKWMERGLEEEFDQRIHSWFALMRVQSDSCPGAISMVHFGVRTAGMGREPAGLANVAQSMNIVPKHIIESKAA